MFEIALSDGRKMMYDQAVTAAKVAGDISSSLAKKAVAVSINGRVSDINTSIDKDSSLIIHTFDDDKGKAVFWHSTSHVLAAAIKRLFPSTKFGIGPSIQNGFYYDLDSDHVFTEDDFTAIESEMAKIIKEDLPFIRKEVSREEALVFFAALDEPYKIELINDLSADRAITIYSTGDFNDLCAGPHIPSTGIIKAFKIMSLAGAYWRGSEDNKMLQRIYAVSFSKQADLDEYLFKLEEAKKRDHRKLGAELGLFMIAEEGPGFPFFLPKGMILRNELEHFWRIQHQKWGYSEIKTPLILNRSLWERSGHWDHYKENMYYTRIDDNDFSIKPMNCPGAMLVFKNTPKSYRDLPLRLAEMGLVHRHEMSGVLHGLMRVRSFTQDDAHIFMMPDQIKGEVKNVINMIESIYKSFGFEYHVELSTRPENSMGSAEAWENATNALRESMDELGMPYSVNLGDGAFYGPKLDFHLEDSLGRTWQCGTVQLDFQMPERFDLAYTGSDNQKHRPIMIHRVIFGSIERFIGILIEHYAGAFPVWLAPVQVVVMNITDKQSVYANEVMNCLKAKSFRVSIDDRNEKIGYKIKSAQMEKIPYMLVCGDREEQSKTVSVRRRGEGDIGTMSLDDFAALLGLENGFSA